MKANHAYNKSVLLAMSLALCFFAVALAISLSQFIWLDEAYTLNTTSASLKQVWFRALNFEGQPPLYFIILKLWRLVNNSFFFARLLSVLLASASVFFVFKISERYIKNISPLFITLLFAFNPVVLWATLEIRVYAMALLFSVLLIMVFLSTYTNGQKPLLRKRILYSVLALMSVYIQYYLVFLLIGSFVFLILNKEWKSARLYIFDMILPVLGFIFLISCISNQMSIHAYQNESDVSFLSMLAFSFDKVSTYLFPYLMYIASGTLKFLLFIVIFAGVLILAGKNINFELIRKNYFVILVVVLLILFTTLLFFTDERNIAQRHSISLLLPLILSFALIVSFIQSKGIKIALLSLMIVGNLIVNTLNYGINKQKGSQFTEVSTVILKNDTSNMPVFCFRYDLALALKYAVPNNNVIPIPVNVDFDSHFDRRKWVLKSANQLDSLFSVNNIHKGFWLVTSENESSLNKSIEKKYNIHYDYKMLNDYVSSNFFVEMEKYFPSGIALRKVSVPEEYNDQ